VSSPESREKYELAAVERRLLTRFSPPLPPEEVARTVADAISLFEGARVRNFVVLFVERHATERLLATSLSPPSESGAPSVVAARGHEAASSSDGGATSAAEFQQAKADALS
jgi:hypothetical protein